MKVQQRLVKLEKAAKPARQWCRQSQVVIYDPKTGRPLVQPDPNAACQIWMGVTDTAEIELILRR